METHRTRNFIIIALLIAAVIYILLPNNPGLHILGINRDLNTKLGLDLHGGLRVLLEADLAADTPVDPSALEDAKQILENRANALGVSEVVFETAGQRRLVGEFPGLTDTSQVIEVLKQVGQLSFVPVGKERIAEGQKIKVDLTNPVPPDQADGAARADTRSVRELLAATTQPEPARLPPADDRRGIEIGGRLAKQAEPALYFLHIEG